MTLGEKLRQAREAMNLDIRDVAENTRISVNYLRAIEQDDYRTLPGGIFNKGFVRTFAKYVGVDEKEAAADYAELMAEQALNAPPPPEETQRRYEPFPVEKSRSSLPTLLFAVLVLGLLSVGIYYGVQYLRENPINLSSLTAPAASPTPSPVAAAPTPSPAAPSAADGLKVQITIKGEEVSINHSSDGAARMQSLTLKPGETKEITGQQSIKISFFKAKAALMQMTVNGRPATFPAPSAKKNALEFEITRDNFAEFLQQ